MAWLQIVQADELQEGAWQQWNRSIPVQSPRGDIFDRRGELLVGSATAKTVVGIPPQVEDSEEVAHQLSSVLDENQERLQELLSRERSAVYLSRRVEEDTVQEVKNLELEGITFAPEGKRYYPKDRLGSQVLGFVGDDQGLSGLEVQYQEELQGLETRAFFPTDAKGEKIPHQLERVASSQEGKNLHTTIDETIQHVIERELNRAMVEYEPKRAMALAADPASGEILAAASKPDFHPQKHEEFDSQNYPLNPVTNSFEPGSTLKLITLAAAIEEGIYQEEETIDCTGEKEVAGTEISCWTSNRGGHGEIDFLEVVEGSCNPGFITLGQRLGKDKLFNYLEGFGFGSATGVDYPGEGEGIVFDPQEVGPLELATTSFGQGISTTPLQQVMAVSAIANGGDLLKPYLVEKVVNQEGIVVQENLPQKVRQVISSDTSQQVTEIMESVVLEGSGANAFVEGYRVAGKTGTAQKVGEDGSYKHGEYILSFIGFAPVEDPQVVLYVAVDGSVKGPQWGSQVSAPLFRRIMEDVLNYKEVTPQEDVFDLEETMVEVPSIEEMGRNEAAALLDTEGLKIHLAGDGNRIVEQTPVAGSQVPLQTRVVAYLGDHPLPEEQTIMPDLRGHNINEAREIADLTELELRVEGSGIAVDQAPPPGTVLDKGQEVRVTFDPSIEGEP